MDVVNNTAFVKTAQPKPQEKNEMMYVNYNQMILGTGCYPS